VAFALREGHPTELNPLEARHPSFFFTNLTASFRPLTALLQRIQEGKQCLLILVAQFLEAIPYVFGFAGVTIDGVFQR